jgi:hypothetical protein
MNVAGAKLGAVVMIPISLTLARCTGSVSSNAMATGTTTAIHITAQNQVRVTPYRRVCDKSAGVGVHVGWSTSRISDWGLSE